MSRRLLSQQKRYKGLPSIAKGQTFEVSRELSVNWRRVSN